MYFLFSGIRFGQVLNPAALFSVKDLPFTGCPFSFFDQAALLYCLIA
jgi:hypothetical protein